MTLTKSSSRDGLGRLAALGLNDTWQVPLLLPRGWDDLTVCVESFDPDAMREGTRALFMGRVSGNPATRFDKTPRLVGYLDDSLGRRIGWTIFGDVRELAQKLRSTPACRHAVVGTLSWFNGWWLRDAEFVAPPWVGRLRPRYPGLRQVINPETVRDRVQALLPATVAIAADWIADTLSSFGDAKALCRIGGLADHTLQQILVQAHNPNSVAEGSLAHTAIERLAALAMISRARETSEERRAASWHNPRLNTARVRQLPFHLTNTQETAVREILTDLKRTSPMRRILTGDVGSGKTAVYALAAMACLDGGGRVAVLLPNQVLVKQVAGQFSRWWPDIPATLVTGEEKCADSENARLVVGTTALLQRQAGRFDLVIVDEQHKFSRGQRESWIGNAHLLEVSATCIPRSQALVELGFQDVSQLRSGHAAKRIHSRLWHGNDRQALFSEIHATVSAGYQALVIYPRRGDGDLPDGDEANNALPSVEESFEQWERHFPGNVRLVHGGMDDAAIHAAVSDIRDGRASILISTTVVEVGVDLPALRRVVVVHADRFGLVTLHQLRGRVARQGGAGYCDLYLPRPVSEKTRARLQVLLDTADGFDLASRDLALRGFGDLAADSDRQHGDDGSFLFARTIAVETVEEMLQTSASTIVGH